MHAHFFFFNATPTTEIYTLSLHDALPILSIIRKRAVGNGFHEEVTILNHKDQPVDLKVRMEAAADFADLFEVKDALKKKGEDRKSTRLNSSHVKISYAVFCLKKKKRNILS